MNLRATAGVGIAATMTTLLTAGAVAKQSSTTMRAVVLDGSKPVVQQIAVPEPAQGDVRVKVRAAAVNPVDWKMASRPAGGPPPGAPPLPGGAPGGPPPRPASTRNAAMVPGFDAAGVIDRVGEGVTDWKVGDEVIVFSDDRGAYAQFVVVPANTIVRKPEKLSFEEAAGIPTVAYAAYDALIDTANVERGQRVLIHGGAGGVGSAAVQLAKSRGAFVLATASARNHEFLRSMGVDQAIDYTAVPFESVVSSLDVVLNTVDADTAARSIKGIKKGGILVSIAGEVPEGACAQAGIRCSGRTRSTPVDEVMRQVAQLAEEGRYKVHVDGVYALERVREAWAKSQTGRTRGKIILRTE